MLTDNGKQFTGRFTKPRPAEVLFERVCREHGITAKLTKPYSPTTTGKVERWHQTLRRELLDAAGPFADLPSAQAAITALGAHLQPRAARYIPDSSGQPGCQANERSARGSTSRTLACRPTRMARRRRGNRFACVGRT